MPPSRVALNFGHLGCAAFAAVEGGKGALTRATYSSAPPPRLALTARRDDVKAAPTARRDTNRHQAPRSSRAARPPRRAVGRAARAPRRASPCFEPSHGRAIPPGPAG